MISFINKLMWRVSSRYIIVESKDLADLCIRCDTLATHIAQSLEPGQVAYYNNETCQIEIGVKH